MTFNFKSFPKKIFFTVIYYGCCFALNKFVFTVRGIVMKKLEKVLRSIFKVLSRIGKTNLYNKRACPTKKEPQQGFLYLTIKMPSSEKFKSNAKTSASTGILFLFYYFLIKSPLDSKLLIF